MSQHYPSTTNKLQLLDQACFHETRDKGLKIPEGVDSKQWATHLAHISAREPGNLINHVRRIYLHLALNQPDALYGAMLDLYLVLGDKGSNLRSRLLHKTRKLLPQEHHDLFLTHYKQGLQRNQPLPASQHSVLGNFFSGKRNLIREQKIQQMPIDKGVDPLELAKEELNYGDITVAQQILEQALLQSPKRLGLHFGLLEIYKHTRSLTDLLKMKEQLGNSIDIAQAAWNQTHRLLESRNA